MEVFWGQLLTFWLCELTAVYPAVELCFWLKETCVPVLLQVCGGTDVSSWCDLLQRSYSVILRRSLYAADKYCFAPSEEWEDIGWLALVWSRHWHILFPPARLYLGADALLEASMWLVSSPVEVAPSCESTKYPWKTTMLAAASGKGRLWRWLLLQVQTSAAFLSRGVLESKVCSAAFIGMKREYRNMEKE